MRQKVGNGKTRPRSRHRAYARCERTQPWGRGVVTELTGRLETDSNHVSMKVSVTERAYVKLVLHSLKHPTRDVFGVLVGRTVGVGDLEVTDVLPMLHSTISVTPSVEIALEQFGLHAELSVGQHLVGVYAANERLGDLQLGHNQAKVADVVKGNAPGKNAVVFVVDSEKINQALELNGGPHVLQMLIKDGESTKWDLVGSQSGHIALAGGATATLAKMATDDAIKKVTDFDDHLDDPGLDWRNGWVEDAMGK